jgi:HAD superfamily hydrolase (TIGR01509 family)
MIQTLKAILFDHDGTLVDSEPTHFQLWVEVLRPYQVALTEELYKKHYAGMPTAANAVDINARFQLNVDALILAQAKNTVTREFLSTHAFPLMPEALEAIGFFKSHGLKLAVVTGANRVGIEATLRHYSLAHHFATVVSSDDTAKSKPAPDCYLLALQRLGLEAAECIAIEDTEHGLAAAFAAGVTCAAVPTPMSQHHDFSKAQASFSSLMAVARWCESQNTWPT